MMCHTHNIKYRGFTLTELALAALICSIVILGTATLLVDSHKGWRKAYTRFNTGISNDAINAAKTFDRIVRKANASSFSIDPAGTWFEASFYDTAESEELDSYALVYKSGNQLKVEYGTLDPRQATNTQTLCSDVAECLFQEAAGSVQMELILDDGERSINLVSSAIMHN